MSHLEIAVHARDEDHAAHFGRPLILLLGFKHFFLLHGTPIPSALRLTLHLHRRASTLKLRSKVSTDSKQSKECSCTAQRMHALT